MRHVQAFHKSHRQFFELFALWFVRTLYKETNRHFNTLRATFTHAPSSILRIRAKKLIEWVGSAVMRTPESPLLWTRGVAERETLSYLDRRGMWRRQLSLDDTGLSVASQYRFLELAATEANDQLLGLPPADRSFERRPISHIRAGLTCRCRTTDTRVRGGPKHRPTGCPHGRERGAQRCDHPKESLPLRPVGQRVPLPTLGANRWFQIRNRIGTQRNKNLIICLITAFSLNGLLHSCLRPSTISSSPVFCIFWLSSTGLGASLSSRRGFCRRLHDFPIHPVRSRYSKQLTVAKIRPPKDSWWRLRLTEQHRHQKCERGAQCRGCSY